MHLTVLKNKREIVESYFCATLLGASHTKYFLTYTQADTSSPLKIL